MFIAYSVLAGGIFLLCLPYVLIRMASTHRFRIGLAERFGLYGDLTSILRSSRSIWVQAASVGEVSAVLPLIRLLRETFPEDRIVVTCQTATGRQAVREKLAGIAVGVLCPLDFPPLIRRFIRLTSPRLLILIETELWPGLILTCGRNRVPVAVVSGRLSRRSFRVYRRFSFLLRPVLERIAQFNLRTEEDARRIKRLGASPERVRVLGNIKFDSLPAAAIDREREQELKERIGWSPGEVLLIGGSTFEGEEEILIRVYQGLKSRFPGLRLLLAPRHLERVKAVEAILAASAEEYRLYSAACPAGEKRVIVLDSMGLLFSLYALASAVFIGRSLRGTGGQNPIEPAVWGAPLLFGPHMENFRDIARALIDGGGAVRVADEAALSAALADLLADSNRRRAMGEKARAVVEARRGATKRNLESLRELILR